MEEKSTQIVETFCEELSETIQILFQNMREKDDLDLIILSRKTLIEMSNENLTFIVTQGIENMRILIESIFISEGSNIDIYKENLLNFISLFKEIIEKNGKSFDKKTVKEFTNFFCTLYNKYGNNQTIKEIDKKRQMKTEVLVLTSRIILYLGNKSFM